MLALAERVDRIDVAWLAVASVDDHGIAQKALGLGSVIAVGLHFSEDKEFLRIAEQAEPWWLLVALVLQASTYLSESQVWRGVANAAGFSLPLRTAYRLSHTKLFVDQALPSAGISGTVVVARSLEQRGMERSTVMGGVVVDSASYHFTYVACLAAALVISIVHHQASPLLEVAAAAFGVLALGLAGLALFRAEGRSR